MRASTAFTLHFDVFRMFFSWVKMRKKRKKMLHAVTSCNLVVRVWPELGTSNLAPVETLKHEEEVVKVNSTDRHASRHN